jgi:hypothetical protein
MQNAPITRLRQPTISRANSKRHYGISSKNGLPEGGERIRVPPSTGRQAKPGSPGWLTDEVCLAMVFNRAEIDRR